MNRYSFAARYGRDPKRQPFHILPLVDDLSIIYIAIIFSSRSHLTSIALLPLSEESSARVEIPTCPCGTVNGDSGVISTMNIFRISGSLFIIFLAGCNPGSISSHNCIGPCGGSSAATQARPSAGSTGGVQVGHTSGRFTATSNLRVGSAAHTAILLPDGNILVAGAGQPGADDLLYSFSSAELLTPSGEVSSTGNLTTAREFHTATLLPNGKVLITGGNVFASSLLPGYSEFTIPISDYYAVLPATSSAELYDPGVGKSMDAGNMSAIRTGHTATLLADGRVLIFGGDVSGAPSAEIYDPAQGKFAPLPRPMSSRSGHTATLLSSGKVLIAGGRNSSGNSATAEIFDPVTNSFRAVGSMAEPRVNHTATVLPNGKVLVAGGGVGSIAGSGTDLNIAPQQVLVSLSSTAELFDPQTETFTPTGTMSSPRSSHTATLLPDGTVLLCGGASAWSPASPPVSYPSNNTAEIYDPVTGTFRSIGAMNAGKYWHTATLLPNGAVMLIGGIDDNASLNLVESFR
jgi:hypothetical protein